MAKFYGVIGFAQTIEHPPGVWKEKITERPYAGDLLRNRRQLQSADQANDNVNLANEISIVADPFAMNNMYSMRYVRYMGANWKVTSVDAQFPRLILTIGGVYNGLTGPQSSPAGEDTAP
jgi:hypothetical protein